MSQICEACAFLPIQVPVRSFTAAGETGHGDRPECANDVSVGSAKHCTFLRVYLDNFPGETSLHFILAARAEQGGSETLVWCSSSPPHPCCKWALSNHSSPRQPQEARPGGGQGGDFAQGISALISEGAERKKQLQSCWLEQVLPLAPINYFPNKHCCLLPTNSGIGKGVESRAALHCSHKQAHESSVCWYPWTSRLNTRTQSPKDRFSV